MESEKDFELIFKHDFGKSDWSLVGDVLDDVVHAVFVLALLVLAPFH